MKTRDFNKVKCIKDETNRLLVKVDEIKNKWREYFDKLFNEESEKITTELDDSFNDTNRQFIRRIQEFEVKKALKSMKKDKVLGLDDIPIEVWRCLRDVAIV
jgi:t-SNARE complex subunit (syntaxin)